MGNFGWEKSWKVGRVYSWCRNRYKAICHFEQSEKSGFLVPVQISHSVRNDIKVNFIICYSTVP